MTRYTSTPWSIFNEIDKIGLLVGLPRLEGEKNPEYKQRIVDVFAHRADSTYFGLIYGITRELGLSITDCFKISPRPDHYGASIVFQDTKCYVYSDFNTLYSTIDRYDLDSDEYTIEGLYNTIVATGLFNIELLSEVDLNQRSMTIFNQSSILLVTSEELSSAGGNTSLDYTDLISGTVSLVSPNLTHKVDNQVDLYEDSDYYIDLTNGVVYSISPPVSGSYIRYKCYKQEFLVQSSPVIIHNVQSEDFKTKLFEQVDSDGINTNGAPTKEGADFINEILSVFSTTHGK